MDLAGIGVCESKQSDHIPSTHTSHHQIYVTALTLQVVTTALTKTGTNLHSSTQLNLISGSNVTFLCRSGTSRFDSSASYNHGSSFTYCHLTIEERGFECAGGITDMNKFIVLA
jgi:hypothetical protein